MKKLIVDTMYRASPIANLIANAAEVLYGYEATVYDARDRRKPDGPISQNLAAVVIDGQSAAGYSITAASDWKERTNVPILIFAACEHRRPCGHDKDWLSQCKMFEVYDARGIWGKGAGQLFKRLQQLAEE